MCVPRSPLIFIRMPSGGDSSGHPARWEHVGDASGGGGGGGPTAGRLLDEVEHPIDSYSATTASIHLLFCANTIPSHAYFHVEQATGLNSEAGGPSAKSCKKIIIFFTRAKISYTLFRMLPISPKIGIFPYWDAILKLITKSLVHPQSQPDVQIVHA